MRLYLINPCNPLVSMVKARESYWNKYTIWKPLGLLALAGLTPSDWDIQIFDENKETIDFASLPKPDLVGITAFTSQANRAYEIAQDFRARHIPVIMGGIHATMCADEAASRVDAVVLGEAESIWSTVLKDFQNGTLQKQYKGERIDLDNVPSARHDLLSEGYSIGSIQTSRGCPLACSFCSVTTFNGGRFRRRPIDKIIEEFKTIKEKYVLIVDDNLIGTRSEHISDTKSLLREMIKAKLRKQWIAQVTINMADDEELLSLAQKAGCIGVFIGFESTSAEGLAEVSKKFAMKSDRNFRASVSRIQHHGMTVLGSFILGLDVDKEGIGALVATSAKKYGVDVLNVMVLTPLPGTKLWESMHSEGRILSNNFPDDWKYFTLTFPVARYKNLSWAQIKDERHRCYAAFYSYPRIILRLIRGILQGRNPFSILVSNLVFRANTLEVDKQAYAEFDVMRDQVKHKLIAPKIAHIDIRTLEDVILAS